MYPEGVVYEASKSLMINLAAKIDNYTLDLAKINKVVSRDNPNLFYSHESKRIVSDISNLLDDKIVLENYMTNMDDDVLLDQALQLVTHYGLDFSDDVIDELGLSR